MLRLLASGSCHGCQTTFPITLFSYTSVPLSWYVLSGKKLLCVCVSAELTSMQTCWTVVVSSRHSWMILFLVAVKSLIPVRGVLRADKGGKREHWKQAMDCRDELKFIVLAQIAVFGHRQACYSFLKYATILSMQPFWCQLILFCLFLTSLYLKHVLQKPVCSPWNMSDYITNL